MTESRIALLATLPMLIGAVLVLGLRKPPLTTVLDAQALPVANDAQLEAPPLTRKPYPGVIVSGYTADVGAEIAGGVLEVMRRPACGCALRRALAHRSKTAGEDIVSLKRGSSSNAPSIERANAELNKRSTW